MSAPRAKTTGTLLIEVIEAEDLPERRRESTVFCQVELQASSDPVAAAITSTGAGGSGGGAGDDDDEDGGGEQQFMTPAVPRTSTPVWEHTIEVAVRNTLQPIVIRVVDGQPGAASNKVIGTVEIDLARMSGAFLDQWFDIAIKRGKARGKLHVSVKTIMSGMSRLLSTVAVHDRSAAIDENESLAEFLRAMPSTVRQIRYTVMRLIYAIAPVLMLRKQLVDLFLWSSKPSSASAFIAFLYLAYYDLFLHATLVSIAAVMAWQAVASMRPGTAFVRAERLQPNDVIERGVVVKEQARVGARTSVLSDVRTVARALEALAELAEKAREAASEPRDAAAISAAFLFVAVLTAFVDMRDILCFVLRVGLTVGTFYSFTLGALYANFPLFQERYAPRQLVAKAKRLFLTRVLRRVDGSAKMMTGRVDEAARSEAEIWSMALRLQNPKTGVPCSDRRTKRRKRIKNAFVAKDAVDWLYSNLQLDSRREAVALMRTFARIGAILLVNDDDSFTLTSSTAGAALTGAGERAAQSAEQLAAAVVAEGTQMLNSVRGQIVATQANFLRRRRLTTSIEGADATSAAAASAPSTPEESRRGSNPLLTSSPAAVQATKDQLDQAALFADSTRQFWCFNETRMDLWRTKLDITLLGSESAVAPRLSLPTLTDRDWRLMLTGAERRSLPPTTVLIERGVASRNVFHVESGEAQLETDDDAGAIVVMGKVGKGTMLGELSSLEGNVLTTARIRAVTALTVDTINMSFLRTLFESEPDLCRRFFHNAALQLADQLDQMDGAANKAATTTTTTAVTTSAPATPASGFKPIGVGVGVLKVGAAMNNVMLKAATAVTGAGTVKAAALESESTDDRFNHLFEISGEVVIQEHAAESGALKISNARGRLFVTQHYLAFHAKVFGRQVKTVLPYATLKAIASSESDPARFKVVSKKGVSHKYKLETKKAADEVIKLVSGLLTNAQAPPADERRKSLRGSVNINSSSSSANADLDDEPSQSETNDESVILTDDDWDLILASSETVTFRRNEKLFENGVQPLGIVQLAHGQARVERNNVVVATMTDGIILGEVSFIRNSVATADVVADSDVVEVHIIPRDKLHALFARQVSVGGRFMQFVCRLLQQRISDRQRQRTRPATQNLSADK